jgi:hypothetical protein
MTTAEYIEERLGELAQHKQHFERLFYFLEEEELFFIPEGEQWSAIECIEHINNVNEAYLAQLTKVCQLDQASQTQDLPLSWFQRKAYQWMSPLSKPGATKVPAPKALLPRRMRDSKLKISAQKVMENFISDLGQIERILRIIPESPELRNTKVISALPPVRIKALTALQLIVPHIGRHLEQAERILRGGQLFKESQQNNPDLIYPTKDA